MDEFIGIQISVLFSQHIIFCIGYSSLNESNQNVILELQAVFPKYYNAF